MKKASALILLPLACLILAGCSVSKDKDDDSEDTTAQVTNLTTATAGGTTVSTGGTKKGH
jgi:hypothetical protein